MLIFGIDKINIEYICVLRERDGHYFYEKEDTNVPRDEIEKLSQMFHDLSSTVLDMQRVIDRLIPRSCRGPRDYLSPQEYNEAYAKIAYYPSYYTPDGYKNLIDQKENQFKASFLEENRDLLNTDPQAYYVRFFNQRDQVLSEFSQELKYKYLSQARQYILAWYYYNTLDRLNNDGSIVLCSLDYKGIRTLEVDISDDLAVSISTNFGFGEASYFFLCLKYKGVLIIPYSHLVKYYFADMRDLVRYTRNYKPCHSSWDDLFRFIEEAANLLTDDKDAFIKTFILDEIDEMVNGLDSLINDPLNYLYHSSAFADGLSPSSFLTVRNIRAEEVLLYRLYPNEMQLTVKVEKVTGALAFLDNLKLVTELIPTITGYISKIKKLTKKIVPEIEVTLNNLPQRINELKKTIESESKRLSVVESTIELIRVLFDDDVKEGRGQTDRKTIELKFYEYKPEYWDLKKKRESLKESIQKSKDNLELFENFKKSLEESLDTILKTT